MNRSYVSRFPDNQIESIYLPFLHQLFLCHWKCSMTDTLTQSTHKVVVLCFKKSVTLNLQNICSKSDIFKSILQSVSDLVSITACHNKSVIPFHFAVSFFCCLPYFLLGFGYQVTGVNCLCFYFLQHLQTLIDGGSVKIGNF